MVSAREGTAYASSWRTNHLERWTCAYDPDCTGRVSERHLTGLSTLTFSTSPTRASLTGASHSCGHQAAMLTPANNLEEVAKKDVSLVHLVASPGCDYRGHYRNHLLG